MCVIAGYIGEERAAPILLKILEREEGLAAGFYTGIATIHEGRLHYRKVVGDVGELIRSTDAHELPGTIGIAHGRTPDGGDATWAHPFVDRSEKLAYIANGAMGRYSDRVNFAQEAGRLLEKGHQFRSARTEPLGNYPKLHDGRTVHFSDIKCQAIAEALPALERDPFCLLKAAVHVYETQPGELVGLCVHSDHPDEIVAVRHNKPLEIARDDAGATYLASASLAFPNTVSWRMRMPAQAGAVFRRGHDIKIQPFTEKQLPMGANPSPTAMENFLTSHLREDGPKSVRQLLEEINRYWPHDVLTPKESVVYEALAEQISEGNVALETRFVPGMLQPFTAPQTWVHWTNQ